MAKHVVAKISEIAEGDRLIVSLQGRSIGIFNVRGKFYGLLNRCPHQGAELCRGSILGQLEADGPGQLEWSDERCLLQCPWHGWEYDLETGQSHFDSRVRPYPVGVEPGGRLRGEVDAGEAAQATATATIASGLSAPLLKEGPFVAETYPVAVEDDYVVVTLPGSAATAPPGSERPAELDAIVSAVERAAEGVLLLTLARADGEALPAWQPGAHVDLILPGGLERQYSLCGDPAETGRWQVAVLREAESRGGSAWIHSQLRVGDRLGLRGPRNHFQLVEADAYLFIAGGIGITPLVPMIDRVAAAGGEWELLYGGRRRRSMAFAERLAAHSGRVALWPQEELGLLDLEALLEAPRAGTAIYCCGPEPLIRAVEAASAAWPAGSLHVERFRPKPGALEGPNSAFEVVLGRSGTTVAVAAEETVAEALEAAGVDIPTSCREGICGTCETAVLEGEVDHRDSFLTDEEREAGATMMACCSRARSSRLVLDV
ncbi:MAG TPA: 2Fe-2S iron-sulfur cluster-binding protein [Solirubrobacterales bacterium]|jgi:ferredoxin-NADP reductase/nitrite reductase/ring-hydroxylating ferredoxin subunit|nr:2Fe-2S iron-sulfur cluster-binding protein [Solirubrobacterales bacterium]